MGAFRPGAIAAVVRKDILSLWPLILASWLLPLYGAAEPLIDFAPQAKTLVVGVGLLATVALALTVIHQDATTSVRHDWLTRPIGVANLVAAKLAFLCVTIAAPLLLATFVKEIAAGHGWSETLLQGVALLTSSLYVIVPIFLLGLVTGSLVQAGVIGLGLVILQVLFTVLFPRIGADPGTRWILDLLASGVGLAFCVAAAVALFGKKRPLIARVIWIGGAAVVMAMLTFVPPSVTIAMQQRLFPGSTVTGPIVTSVVDPCVAVDSRQQVDIYGMVQARISPTNLPRGWVINVDGSSVKYQLSAGGPFVDAADATATPRIAGLGRAISGYGLRPGDLRLSDIVPNPAGIRAVQWNYDITILEPGVSRDLPIDGRRRYLPGIGYCDAKLKFGDAVEISCFKPFAQPATIGARPKGDPADGCPGCGGASYRPALLDGVGDTRRLWITKATRPSSTLTLTTYEARGHISRQSTTTGPLPVCPKRSNGEPETLLEVYG